MIPRSKLSFAHLPTPIDYFPELNALVGTRVWVKRDDMTAGAAAGNKIRKLEYLLAEATEREATTVVTCGGLQSNHARASALLAARLGMKVVLLLRSTDPAQTEPATGNLMLDRLCGAEVRFISPEQYARRDELLSDVAVELEGRGQRPYVIPEGGSNAVGALGYVDAMREVRGQLDFGLGGGPEPFDAIVHACGSGGTAAGVALGAHAWNVAPAVHAMAVCDDRATFNNRVGGLVRDVTALQADLQPVDQLQIHDAWKGPAYAVASDEQRRFIARVAQCTGLVLDPVYSGKALFGLSMLDPKPSRVLFIHTGGLPGLLAQAQAFASELLPS